VTELILQRIDWDETEKMKHSNTKSRNTDHVKVVISHGQIIKIYIKSVNSGQ